MLITGGAGFIGSNLARTLLRVGARITLVDSLVPEYGGNLANLADLSDHVRLNISDVRDPHSLKFLVREQDYLFNLAGQTSHLDSMVDPFTDLQINAAAQLSILEACRLHNPQVRIVFASTRQIYGKPGYLPVDERHPLQPVDINGIHKVAAEWYHTLYHRVYDLSTSCLRLTNTYGPGMRIKDARQTFVGIWIKLVLQGQPFEVWEGDQRRDFTYIDDCVAALLAAATVPQAIGKTYNVGGCEVITLKQLAKLLVELNGSGNFELRRFPAERKRIDIGDFFADDSLLRTELGWQPTVPLKSGLSRTLDYYRKRLTDYL